MKRQPRNVFKSSENELVPYLSFTLKTNLLIRQTRAERQINLKRETLSEKYPTTTKMTGEGNESAEHEPGKKEEQSSRDEETELKVEDNIPVVKVANAKERKRKGGSKSDSSEPVDDDSEKNIIDDDVPLSFPQRVSYCIAVVSVGQELCFDVCDRLRMTLHT
jgi:hypothetical protein